mmetsp:Transcript_31481/g.92116  ORF Transcript_31481/g.92116 Transcript_31481/m.92116 type:complete len:233 (+) Transcript_31481:1638-2336(+)
MSVPSRSSLGIGEPQPAGLGSPAGSPVRMLDALALQILKIKACSEGRGVIAFASTVFSLATTRIVCPSMVPGLGDAASPSDAVGAADFAATDPWELEARGGPFWQRPVGSVMPFSPFALAPLCASDGGNSETMSRKGSSTTTELAGVRAPEVKGVVGGARIPAADGKQRGRRGSTASSASSMGGMAGVGAVCDLSSLWKPSPCEPSSASNGISCTASGGETPSAEEGENCGV